MADLVLDELLPELARRLSTTPDNPELIEALDAAADDVLDYSGLADLDPPATALPDTPRVRRNLVPYAEAIYLAAAAPIGNYGAIADDTFPVLVIPSDLHARYAPRFDFLSTSWGIG